MYYRGYRTSVTEQAITQLEQVQASVGLGEREAAKTQLYQYLDRFEGSVYALEARLVLGQLLLEDGAPDEAIDVLAPGVRALEQEPIGIQAAFLMAGAYEEAGRTEEAERLFLRIADAAELTFQLREALSGAARIRAESGDLNGAAELYEEGLATMELGDPERSFWEMRLAEVTARSTTPGGGSTEDPGTA
jgi:predicted negative regulator of RcsB-dependent stress response